MASSMRIEIARVFGEHDIEIAFPQLDIHFVSGSEAAPRPEDIVAQKNGAAKAEAARSADGEKK